MDELVLIDGNSIINRAFYGIMGSKMLMTEDGTYTNAVYGFLNILFKNIEDIKPKYLAVAFDLKAPTHRHKMYEAYKAGRKGMPDELASQMPLLKDVLRAMNISIIEKEGYEADDILGTLAKWGSSQNLDVTILTGDRDAFQLAEENIMIRIPRTKMGKTETDEFKTAQILETYGLLPIQMIEVKGLMGDSSDNIPGVPGIGEKTALSLIKEYETIDNLYKNLENGTDNLKGKLRENLTSNKELAILSRTLGTIDINAPIEKSLELLEIKEWDKSKVLEIFEKLKFNKFIERFNLRQEETSKSIEISEIACEYISEEIKINKLKEEISSNKIMYYYMNSSDSSNEELIIKKKIDSICIYSPKENVVFVIDKIQSILDMFENAEILKCGYKQKIDYILLKQAGIKPNNFMFDIEIAAYILNASITKYSLEYLAQEYLDFSVEEYSAKFGIDINRNSQINLFETPINTENKNSLGIVYSYVIYNLYNKFISKLGDINGLDLFNKIEMPLSEVLSEMQYEGMSVDKEELVDYGNELKVKLDELTKEIYSLSGEEFNINSPKQLGEILFNKLNLTTAKKNKSGYSTDVEVLEKLKSEHPVIEKILEYRQLNKLYTTYVEGLIPYINSKTGKIHSYFHQSVTATGRLSSSDPNLQNIPTRFELGKKLRKVFKPVKNNIYIDADYSQIELRILAHISNDENMIDAFNNNKDIHIEAASKVFGVPIEDVTKELRSKAKAVNFGIVYGISDYGLGEQIGVNRKVAKEYIDQYLEKYSGIKFFMENIVEKAKEQGYVETLYNRRRYIPEVKSNNYTVRQFGARIAMNTPIQGTAADIIKIAMVNVYNELKKQNLKSKLILQVHDELLIEAIPEEETFVQELLKKCMEDVIKLNVPLVAELSKGTNWYGAK